MIRLTYLLNENLRSGDVSKLQKGLERILGTKVHYDINSNDAYEFYIDNAEFNIGVGDGEELGTKFAFDIYNDGATKTLASGTSDNLNDIIKQVLAAARKHKKSLLLKNESVNEEFTAVSNKSGKMVVFKDKAARDAAVKAGTHSKEDDKDGGDEPKGEKKPNMFSKDAGYDAPDAKSDDTPSIDLSADADGKMSSKSANALTDLLNKELGVNGFAEVTDNGVITYGLANSDGEWNSALYIGKNDDGKFAVSVESDGGQTVGDSYKQFDTEKEAVAYAVELGKKYKDEFAAPEPKETPKAGLLPSQSGKNSFQWTTGKLKPKKADKKLVSLVNKLSKKAKLDPNKISREEYEKRMLSVVHDALEDANFHGANRQIFADLQGKPELSKRPDYSKAPEIGTPERDEWNMNNSIYNKNFDGITSEFDGSNDFATTISSESGWDGEQTIAALLQKIRKDGHGNLADKIQTSFDKAMENNEGLIKLTNLL